MKSIILILLMVSSVINKESESSLIFVININQLNKASTYDISPLQSFIVSKDT